MGTNLADLFVAPLTGAWIETITLKLASLMRVKSHPSRVRGLKLDSLEYASLIVSRTPHGCVD